MAINLASESVTRYYYAVDPHCHIPSFSSASAMRTHKSHMLTDAANSAYRYVLFPSMRGTELTSPAGTCILRRWRASVIQDAHTCTINIVEQTVDRLTRLRRLRSNASRAVSGFSTLLRTRGASMSQE